MHQPADMNYRNSLFYVLTQVIGITALLSWIAYSVQYSDLDMTVSRYFYDTVNRVFPLRHQLAVERAGNIILWILPVAFAVLSGVAALCSNRFKSLESARSVLWTVFVIFCLVPLVVWGLKHYTAFPRPFTLAAFGGVGQLPSSFWAPSGMPGGDALPSFHAAVGYSLFSVYFAGWALNRAKLRWLGLALALVAGVAFGLLRVAQGEHFLSETIWSAAVVWFLCSVLFYPFIVTRHRKESANLANYTLDEIWRHLSIVQVRRRNTLTAYGVLFVCLLPFLASGSSPYSVAHQAVEWVGMALIFSAFLGRCWCILYLGGHKGADLIDQGPYSISRNPLYLFSMLAVAGIGAQSGSVVLGPILALFVYAVFNNVIDEEERLLRKVFGPQFDEYCAKVPRFGPRFKNWKCEDELLISVSGLWNTVRDAVPYFLAIPLFELIELGQSSGWLPVLIRLP